ARQGGEGAGGAMPRVAAQRCRRGRGADQRAGVPGAGALRRPGAAERAALRDGHAGAGGRPHPVLRRADLMPYAIKAEIRDPKAKEFVFDRQKTMYGGKRIAEGDTIFLFASENEGGPGLVAEGVVTAAKAVPRKAGIE